MTGALVRLLMVPSHPALESLTGSAPRPLPPPGSPYELNGAAFPLPLWSSADEVPDEHSVLIDLLSITTLASISGILQATMRSSEICSVDLSLIAPHLPTSPSTPCCKNLGAQGCDQ